MILKASDIESWCTLELTDASTIMRLRAFTTSTAQGSRYLTKSGS